MIKNKFIILTGPIKSGKTTLLMDIFGSRDDCGGFLTPDISGKRFFYRIDEKEYFPFEIERDKEKKALNIGTYTFDMQIFDLGCSMLNNAWEMNYKCFVIDEIGKLEIANQGFAKGLNTMYSNMKSKNKMIVISVIRDYLLKEIITKYGMVNSIILDVGDPDCQKKLEAMINYEEHSS